MIKPSRVQYLQIKSQYADSILFYQVGDFYETYDEDAYVAARVRQIVLTKKTYGEERVPMAGVPLHALENYVGKLIQHGYKVAICEQVGEVGKGLVERAVTRILTAGTLSEPNLLPVRQNNFLVAIASGRTQTALAAVDVSTGEFSVTWFAPDELPAALEGELQRLAPTECLLVEGSRAYKFPSETMTLTTCLPYFFELEARLDGVEELYESPAMRSRFTMFLQRLGDIERIAGRVRQGTAIPREALALREYLQVIPQLQSLLRGCNALLLAELADFLDACPQVGALIDKALTRAGEEDEREDDGRLIRAGFHAELDELIASIHDSKRWITSLEARERERSGIKSLRVGYNKVFGYYIEVSRGKVDQVPPDYMRKQTLTNAERLTTPELKEHEARVLSAEERIDEMERSIYADVLRQLGVYYPQLIATAGAIAQVDVLLNFAEVAAHAGYVRPVIEQSSTIEIVGGRHPFVEQALDGDTFIPNDAHLEAEHEARIILLTGPNMAGKSTYLRQVALITLLAQIGCFVPARSARIGLVDRIFTRVGAEDDIASGKSTFMIEMEETATILHHATRHSLIILDEIGRGTSTYDGLAIARAVVEHLHNVTGARTLFATHYHELTSMADELPHLRVYTMAIREDEQRA